MAGVARAIVVPLAESVKDFLHVVEESMKIGTPMETSVSLTMIFKAQASLEMFEKNDGDSKQEGGSDE